MVDQYPRSSEFSSKCSKLDVKKTVRWGMNVCDHHELEKKIQLKNINMSSKMTEQTL